MDMMTVIRERRSIRRYRSKEVPTEVLGEILEAARLAPSAANRQAWELIVVTDQDIKDALVPICKNQKFVGECSVFLAAVEVPEQKWSRTDLAIMMDHIALTAHEKGLGTCWIGAFDREMIGNALGVPSDRSVAVCLTLGYPDESPAQRSRKSPQELFHWNKYGERR